MTMISRYVQRVKYAENPASKLLALFGGFIFSISVLADSGITFKNLADDASQKIDYEHVHSTTFAEIERFRNLSLTNPLSFTDLFDMPHQSYGIPGAAVFDYDRDGDLDIYLANGPGAANSLYSSQLKETGKLSFIEVGVEAGVDATTQDSSGVCYGDIDNDGDYDLYVLGRGEPNRLYINQGNARFVKAESSGVKGGSLTSSSCAMGDVNNDGLLDITVSNAVDLSRYSACFVEVFSRNQPNQLYLNNGDNTFTDASATSGILRLKGFPGYAEGSAGYTWASAMVDINRDGNTDIIYADEQCGIPTTTNGGVDRGYIHVMLNDGTGQFKDNPVIINEVSASAWMGLAFGDLNCDGNLDMLVSNAGDYGFPSFGGDYVLGGMTTRWFLGKGDGSFTDPGVGGLKASVFTWGVGIFDYDNDGDQDMIWQGGLDLDYQVWADNPGVILANDGCSANFTWDKQAIKTNYTRRNPRGLAMGDLDQNGFVDFVTVSNFTIPDGIALKKSPAVYGSVFDDTAYFLPLFEPQVMVPAPDQFVWNGIDLAPGTATIEINSGDNDNGWVAVNLAGSIGLTDRGQVNRDGIGSVISFTPEDKPTVMTSVPSGPSFASQHSLEANFGLGSAESGTLEVLWPGGTRNRLYHVKAGERIVMPEIPCSFDAYWENKHKYHSCVYRAVSDLVNVGVIKRNKKHRYINSAMRAFKEYKPMEGYNKEEDSRYEDAEKQGDDY